MRSLILATAISGFFLTACAGSAGSSSSGSGQTASQGTDVKNVVDMQSLQKSSDNATAAISDAKAALDTITNKDGSFKFSVIFQKDALNQVAKSQMEAQFLTDGLAAKLTTILNVVVDKVKLAKADIEKARAALTVELSKVDANSPAAAQIQALMSQIDIVESQYSTLVHSLASKINLVTQGFNQLSGLANSFCPIPVVCGAAVWLVLNPIEQAILDFQAKLMII